ncbi:osmolarity response regulator transcription factor OmpR [Basilea psittacipulmonis]|uniref:Chemotaxis protein CheY n=1 Tax=Basilea psittacipulmonis DSM 24701 TaxID=1072685 RepID=A0A077DG83_9BURK|nr:two-component system response regulator OmpR [Basilea psittacipulmonis]AIL33186.1 chemotaxis protein CheY [Basilea psittacipulmonis DSM 24701]
MTNRKILIVDDDERLRELLQQYLQGQGYYVDIAKDAVSMDQLFPTQPYDLIVLDIMLPDEDGLSICRRLRGKNITTPILMLTAKTEEIDRILGLEMGADDYLTKPFNPRELLARINAILRRVPKENSSATTAHALSSHSEEIYTFGQFTLNLTTRTLSKQGKIIPITTSELGLLKVFIQNANTPLSRDQLMEQTKGKEYEVFNRSLDVQISRLRKLIEPNPTDPIHIKTVWGVGYVFITEPNT